MKEDKTGGHVARMGEMRNAYNILIGKPEGKRSLGRPRRRWEDNIRMDVREMWTGCRDEDQRRAVANMVMNLRCP
jgi:hypothetical protein